MSSSENSQFKEHEIWIGQFDNGMKELIASTVQLPESARQGITSLCDNNPYNMSSESKYNISPITMRLAEFVFSLITPDCQCETCEYRRDLVLKILTHSPSYVTHIVHQAFETP